MSFAMWLRVFDHEFRRRTGISWEEACGDLSVPRMYFGERITPTNAVLAEIQHLDLTDLTLVPWLTAS